MGHNVNILQCRLNLDHTKSYPQGRISNWKWSRNSHPLLSAFPFRVQVCRKRLFKFSLFAHSLFCFLRGCPLICCNIFLSQHISMSREEQFCMPLMHTEWEMFCPSFIFIVVCLRFNMCVSSHNTLLFLLLNYSQKCSLQNVMQILQRKQLLSYKSPFSLSIGLWCPVLHCATQAGGLLYVRVCFCPHIPTMCLLKSFLIVGHSFKNQLKLHSCELCETLDHHCVQWCSENEGIICYRLGRGYRCVSLTWWTSLTWVARVMKLVYNPY